MARPVDDLLPVGRIERAAIVARGGGQSDNIAAIGIHRIDVEVAIAGRGEDDAAAIGREGRLGIVAGAANDGRRLSTSSAGGENVVAVVDGPDVTL